MVEVFHESYNSISKDNITSYDENEYIVMKEDGWKVILVVDHFKNKMWYELEMPNNAYLPNKYENIFDAIDDFEALKNFVH